MTPMWLRRQKERRAPEGLKSSVEVTPEIAPGYSRCRSTRGQFLQLQSALVPIQVETETMNPGSSEISNPRATCGQDESKLWLWCGENANQPIISRIASPFRIETGTITHESIQWTPPRCCDTGMCSEIQGGP